MRIFSTHWVTVGLLLGAVFGQSRASITEYQQAVENEPSLISYYTFDAGDLKDVESAHHGTAGGTVAYGTGVGGGSDRAIVLTGTGHVNLGQVEAFDFLTGLGTIEAWVRADWSVSPGYNPTIFADRAGGPVNWSIHMDASKARAGLWDGASYQTLATPATGLTWHHLAVVFDYDAGLGEYVFKLYWDGEAAGMTRQGMGGASSSPTQLGSASAGGLERWVGALDEVAFYSDPLSDAAIRAHYNAFLVGDPPTILRQPQGGTYLSGVPLSLSVEAKGTQLAYQWYKDGAPIAGATSATLARSPLGAAHTGAYQVIVSNPAGQVTSDTVAVQLGALSSRLTNYQAAIQAEPSLISHYTFDRLDGGDVRGPNPGTLDGQTWFGAGIGGGAGQALVLEGAGRLNLGTVGAFDFAGGMGTFEAWVRADWTSDPGYAPTIAADRDGIPVNWSLHMNPDKAYAGLWDGSSYQPQPTPGAGTAWHHLAVVFSYDWVTGSSSCTTYWDGVFAGATAQGLGYAPESPTQLGSSSPVGQEGWRGALDEVAFYSDALDATAIAAHYAAFTAGEPPAITVQPASARLVSGNPLVLTVGAQGLDLAYQWHKNDVAIPGAVGPGLAFGAVTADDAGTYHVTVTNPSGSVRSQNAVVTVLVPDLPRYQAAVRAEAGLVSYYTFDASDASDSHAANHGLFEVDAQFGPGVGLGADQAAMFYGAGYVGLGQVDSFDFSDGTGTVEAWIRADWTLDPGYDPTLFADRDGNPVNWSIHMTRSKTTAGLWNGQIYQAVPVANVGGSWHHLAAVFDRQDANSTFTLYWDGLPVTTTYQGIGASPGSPTQIGSSSPVGQEVWLGAIDEVAFYSQALSATAVRAHYEALLGPLPSAPTLVAGITGDQLTLSWSSDAAGYILESAAGLPAATWTEVPGAKPEGTVVETPGAARFYRLRKGD
ncbi:MAG TPA: hypothetical protein PKM73_17280 [Verrucomicrobiota bacterium]|nr:hypothetical protein [Verrucomicrobiota bacterium]HNU52989.1 hypothetical protein [Verrucomicrobiota bacterium]